MKKTFKTLIIAALVLSLSACGNAKTDSNSSNPSSNTEAASSQSADSKSAMQTPPEFTAEQALEIALEQAGVTMDSIRDVETKLETENGILVYDVEFKSGNIEYSYEVNAETGAIVEADRDNDNKAHGESY